MKKIEISGTLSALAGTVLTFKVRPGGGTGVVNFGATLPASSGIPWTYVTSVVNRAGVFISSSSFSYWSGGVAVTIPNFNQQVNGGASVAWLVTAQWGAASPSNTITQQMSCVTSLWG